MRGSGIIYALAAFGFWGLTPVYFKAIASVPPLEILGHRIVWSVPVTALLITLGRDWHTLARAVASPKVLVTLFVSAGLVAVNWFIFTYAVVTGRVLHASLGYFIIPLVNVVLGMVFLRERLRPLQGAAVLLAAAGTLNLTLRLGEMPWISLTLALSFGSYGLLRKTVRIEAVNGLFVETVCLCPVALLYLAGLGATGNLVFAAAPPPTALLLSLAGVVTVLPLVWFTCAARRLPLSTLGLLQYLAPTVHFLLGVFAYQEPFTTLHLVSFGLIWCGLGLFTADSIVRKPSWGRG